MSEVQQLWVDVKLLQVEIAQKRGELDNHGREEQEERECAPLRTTATTTDERNRKRERACQVYLAPIYAHKVRSPPINQCHRGTQRPTVGE